MTDGTPKTGGVDQFMNWRVWMEQGLPFTDLKRGGATVWPRGEKGLIGDSLGPILHLHDGASEIFYFVDGRCRLEIGNSEEFFEPGDYVLVPPGVPHNLWNAGDDDLLVFWLVAPNFNENKWRTDHFPPGAMNRRAFRGRVARGVELPSDANIRTRLVSVDPAPTCVVRTAERQEAIVYVLEGRVDAEVGARHRRMAEHDFVDVPASTPCL